jgi:hypothetical protein
MIFKVRHDDFCSCDIYSKSLAEMLLHQRLVDTNNSNWFMTEIFTGDFVITIHNQQSRTIKLKKLLKGQA